MNNIKILSLLCGLLLLVLACAAPTTQQSANGQSSGSVQQPLDAQGGDDTIVVEGAQISLDRNVYFVYDGSGSMGDGGCSGDFGNKNTAAKWASTEFVTQQIPSDDGVGLFVFDSHGRYERVPIGKDNREELLLAINEVDAGGGTPLREAMEAGVDALRLQRAKQLGYGEFILFVVTDGEARGMSQAVSYAAKYGIPITTIGFCLQEDHELAVHSVSYRNALDPEELLGAMQEVLAESDVFDLDAANFDQ